jgi:hypothetical protein
LRSLKNLLKIKKKEKVEAKERRNQKMKKKKLKKFLKKKLLNQKTREVDQNHKRLSKKRLNHLKLDNHPEKDDF